MKDDKMLLKVSLSLSKSLLNNRILTTCLEIKNCIGEMEGKNCFYMLVVTS